ncbi:hypothetical protein IG193_00960 [Infirmifilum lucidum]|uniref:PaREP7 n=1 Tax=Infirmifilum lucidum TaxID=2776706 RepID=A0A7L9FGW2_9CREN|nr:hypothetical protein [Infirmifilum lucidum]QOJ79068.1 hypothetical protein IG193_00960 [Infirmifilum lucidum]
MSSSLKKKMLELLEKDVEFRYAVAGYLGVLEVLKRLDSLGEEQAKTWENLNKIWENLNKLWENTNKLWEEVKALREDQKKLWEEVRSLREGQEALKADVDWVKSAIRELQQALGVGLEFYTARWVSEYFEARGYTCQPIVHATLPVDGFREVDVLCLEPLAVAEVKSSVPSLEKAEEALAQLLKAVEAAEKFTGRKAELRVLAVQTAPEEVARHLAKRASELGVTLILGRET